MTDASAATILMVDDNPGDIRLTQEAFKDLKLHNEIYVAEDGEEALDFLFRRNGHENAARPDIVLLDLNLPRKSGFEVLEEIKNDARLRTLPVAILTSSSSDRDVARGYGLQANCFITKPIDFTQLLAVVRTFQEFWLSVVKLPVVVEDD